MKIPDTWNTLASAWIGRVKGRVAWGIAIPDGGTAAAALPDHGTPAEAAEQVLAFLSTTLNTLGVDLHTNHSPLREVLATPELLAAAGYRVSHVTVLESHQLPAGDTTMDVAQAAAAAAVDQAGPVYLRAATDGGRRRKGPKGSRTRDAGKNGEKPAVSAKGGYGWILEDGRHGFGPLDSTCALESELVAIERLLASTSRNQPLLVHVDSRPAIAHAKAALAGKPNPEQATKATGAVLDKIKAHADREVVLTWVKGHGTHAMNKAADELATLGRRGLDLYGSADLVDEMADQVATRMLTALDDDAAWSQAS